MAISMADQVLLDGLAGNTRQACTAAISDRT